MKINRFLLLVFIAVIAVGVTGCKLPASTAPAATPTTGSGFPVPGTETMGLFETIATQTAAAAQGGGVPATTQSVGQPTKPAVTGQTGSQPQATPAPSKTPVPPTPTKKAVTVPKATAGLPSSYTLQKGEYPYCIARRFNLNPGELLSINGLSTSSMTFPGTRLTIPQTGHTFPDGRELHSHPTNFTVRSGDTIYTIACYFGDVDPLVIADVNGLSSPYNLTTGDVLQIP
jgi:LysM repeat protein